jgi:uncharacterized membrane protein HdeD (DUF308 family)
MNTHVPTPFSVLRHEIEAVRAHWLLLLVVGILLIVLGTIALGASVFFTFLTVVIYGVLLLIGGVGQVVGAFMSRDWSGFFLHLLTGVLYLIVGIFFVRDPGEAALAMTLLLACLLMVGGVFKVVAALTYRFASWTWMLLSGVIDVVLGLLIWRQWPLSGLWVIGLFVGINMIFNGWSWVMLALSVRSLPRPAAV